MVQWLRLCTSTAGGVGSNPGRGTKIPHTEHSEAKKKKRLNEDIGVGPDSVGLLSSSEETPERSLSALTGRHHVSTPRRDGGSLQAQRRGLRMKPTLLAP